MAAVGMNWEYTAGSAKCGSRINGCPPGARTPSSSDITTTRLPSSLRASILALIGILPLGFVVTGSRVSGLVGFSIRRERIRANGDRKSTRLNSSHVD